MQNVINILHILICRYGETSAVQKNVEISLDEKSTCKIPGMLKTEKMKEMETEAESLVEFYCDDDIHDMSLWGFSPTDDFSFGCEEKIYQSELFLSMSCQDSLSSLSQIKGK